MTLLWLVWIRWGLVIGECILLVWAHFGLGLSWPWPRLLCVIGLGALSNVWLERQKDVREAHVTRWIFGALCFDLILLTFLLEATGGPENPFSVFYLVYVTLGGLFFAAKGTRTIAAASSICFATLFVVPAQHAHGHGHAHHMQGASSFHLQGMWLAFTLAAFFIGEFVSKISRSLRARENELRQVQSRAAKAEKFAALSTLAAGAAHELGTPLSTIAVIANELSGQSALESFPGVLDDVRLIRQEVSRCKHIVHAMIGEAGASLGEMPSRRTLDDLEKEVTSQLARKHGRGAVDIEYAVGDFELPFSGLVEAVLNLIRNGLDAQSDAGIQTPVEVTAMVDPAQLRIRIRDYGKGIPKEVLPKLGEPFLSTKPVGEGMGLGVFLARSFAEKIGGTLSFETHEGTVAILTLPRYFKADSKAQIDATEKREP